ncbi:hypothetical protein VPH35_015411 [Triticum aestivum]
MVISFNSVFDVGWKGVLACYICGTGRGLSLPSLSLSPVQLSLSSALSTTCCVRGECAMAGQGGNVSDVLGRKPVSGEGSRVVMDATAMCSPPATAQAGPSLHQLGTKSSGHIRDGAGLLSLTWRLPARPSPVSWW